ncbi:uncharacterized protein LOC126555521 [Aphis gossypii]|uniref:uncharacterized protein LOC126555521 n=1 Tax=Aphis gossypii TaxID=80765 RepID=UPI002159B328|nr:uncharacterized protein LOC126555521 [Aphis gossypii]
MDVYLSESESDDETLLLVAMLEDEEQERKPKRKCWVHDINKEREIVGEYTTLMPQLRADPIRFFIYFRMIPDYFDEILGWISDEIYKITTNFRMPISPSERLAIALR